MSVLSLDTKIFDRVTLTFVFDLLIENMSQVSDVAHGPFVYDYFNVIKYSLYIRDQISKRTVYHGHVIITANQITPQVWLCLSRWVPANPQVNPTDFMHISYFKH
jgi:hypothetical protein